MATLLVSSETVELFRVNDISKCNKSVIEKHN